MILQIPVEDEASKKGWRVSSSKPGDSSKKVDSVTTTSSSGHQFNLTVVTTGCPRHVTATPFGWKLVLIFQLVWNHPVALSLRSYELPSFLSTLTEVGEILQPWSSVMDPSSSAFPPPIVSAIAKILATDRKGKVSRKPPPKPPAASSHDIIDVSSSDMEDCEESTEPGPRDASGSDSSMLDNGDNGTSNEEESEDEEESLVATLTFLEGLPSSSDRDPVEPNVLFFVLSSDLAGSEFPDEDAFKTRLFQCLVPDVVEVHTAVLKPGSFATSSWRNSSGFPVKLNLQLDVKTQLVGSAGSLMASVEEVSVLVIWPRKESFNIYCRYGFDSILDRMEGPLFTSASPNLADLKTDLNRAVAYCKENPQTLTTHRILRLFHLCTVLEAKEEGLTLLNLIGVVEGIRDKRVSKSIAVWESTVCGSSYKLKTLNKVL